MITHFPKISGFLLVALVLMSMWAGNVNAGVEKEVAGRLVDGTVSYTVQPGDTLSEIADTFNIDVNLLISANNLKTSAIHPYQVLVIPSSETETLSSSRSIISGEISREDFLLLARAIYAEARGESFDGQVAVGAVILNRTRSPYFPNTIREVITQRDGNLFQFTPVSNGTINLTPDATAIKAARKALEGYDPTGGALFFYNPHIASDNWIKTLPVLTKIGKHIFATKT
ncbi:cell wall hydrolase [Desulfallas sp. Bu1-1]|jgi:N-acetylmuramoyl-L-alanine amidase|uniref:cell wall hydrolase n=1 Tax=Desulfallas sp. Bu1-1 TaxID=2787620 RepID=UPI00189E8379|nr:cell wall hydrolase [Desulfallas sp. Bu1-1]MBF7083298.1 cell wall hydrolase [Desulfallas sp. Bu1-1]